MTQERPLEHPPSTALLHGPPGAAGVRVAGRSWTTEERFQTGKGLVGLDRPPAALVAVATPTPGPRPPGDLAVAGCGQQAP
jgi:hypothetical protein